MGQNNYFNADTEIGKFLAYFIDEGHEEDDLDDDEFGEEADFEDCSFVNFDPNFPLQNNHISDKEKRKEIFRILQNCYSYGTANPHSKPIADLHPKPIADLHPKPSSKPVAHQMPKIKKQPTQIEINTALVVSWLDSLRPSQAQYHKLFIKGKYDSLDKIAHINSKDTLEQIGISLKGHITKIWKGIMELKKPDSPYENIHNLPNDDDSDDNKYETPSAALKPLEFSEEKFYDNPQCDSDDIQKCGHIKRLLITYIRYEDWNQNGDKKYGQLLWEHASTLLDKCKIIHLMDDYHHYRDYHAESRQISQLKAYIMKRVHISYCEKYHDLENHHIAQADEETTKLAAEQVNKLQILDNIHLEWMHNVQDINNLMTPQGATPLSGATLGGQPMSPLTPLSPPALSAITPQSSFVPSSFAPHASSTPMSPVTEGAEDEDAQNMPLLLKKTKGNYTIVDKFKNNQIFSKHQLECHKFVSSVNLSFANVQQPKLKAIKMNSYANASINYDDFDSDFDSDEEEEKEANDDNGDIPSYSFGRRWFYWDYYEKLEPAKFVKKMHPNFKAEVLKNKIYCLQKIDWDSTNKKAKQYLKCSKAKALEASGVLRRHYFEEHDGDAIRLEHIIALLFYCNYDNLQSALSQTFRIMECDTKHGENEAHGLSVWDKVRERNREYANWSRLLREAVELFGIQFRDHRNVKLYHGIACELVFDSINCRFCAPTSMTTTRAVAQSFSEENGLILELTIYDLDLRFFDVEWLSNYPTESERLFIGGHQLIRIHSITVLRLNENNEHYDHYMCAIGIIQNMFDARHNPMNHEEKKLNNKTINAIKNLLFLKYGGSDHKLMKELSFDKSVSLDPSFKKSASQISLNKNASLPTTNLLGNRFKFLDQSTTKTNVLDLDFMRTQIPQYIRTLFLHFCSKWDKKITIDIAKFNKNNEYKQFKQSLTKTMIEDDNSWVALDLICSIFENVLCIHIINGFEFKDDTFKKLHVLLGQNENVFKKLNEIKIEISGYMNAIENLLKIRENVEKIKVKMAQINWGIGIIVPQEKNNAEDEKKDTLYDDINIHTRYVVLVKGGNQTTAGYTPGDGD